MNAVRLGVTGHRTFLHHVDILASIESVLDRVLATPDDADPARAVIVSSLAEGADRMVAELVLQRGGDLEAVLPLAADDYAADFASVESRAEFERLLGRAKSITVVGSRDGLRETAYESAGRAMVQASDVVIALWDGTPARGRGGTAEIIQYALDHGVLVEIVLVER